jgi:starvation-inducible DNA-binding protein
MEQLDRILATIFVVRQNIHGRHFNVTGPHFRTLHLLFQEAYELLDEWYDKTGELIRRQGDYAIYNIPAMCELSLVKSDEEVYGDIKMAASSELELQVLKVLAEQSINSGDYDNATQNDIAALASAVSEMWYKIGSFTGATIPK